MTAERLTAIDLFSGAGGLTLGLQQAGFTVLAGVEINPVAAQTYRLNHPNIKCFEQDICLLDSKEILRELNLKKGELDLLAGCPPCQGFSTLRTRKKCNSLEDSRNELIYEYLRLVEDLLPKCIMLENVPALAKDQRMEVFLNRIEELGYHIDSNSVQVEDAADYGVPQRRKRMILKVARNLSVPHVEKVEKKITIREYFLIHGLKSAGGSGDPWHDYEQKRSPNVLKIIKNIPKNGGSRKDLPSSLVLECHKNRPGQFGDVYGRMKWDDVAPTITGGCNSPSKGRFLHPEEDRCITLREAALLQTFPLDYKFPEVSQASVALMIGNALPPELIRRHALAFKSILI
ncbi:DNA cytosine methyltransferase [Acinetobacter terrestris]|uniref:Cytosine-specific methyltransferase n=1 Tax=Acinetobacter terrestris TaxID=2529843 RepID=A0ABX1USN8_9GAMM|nr:DNA cytosine methyltransferase [Acinetobacter terrestris]NNH25641.1 DNA cytosine methyltransferase [Acinetobacter terrestris]